MIKRLLIIIVSSFFSGVFSPVIADLGKADKEEGTSKIFDAYCLKIGNKCKVTFIDGSRWSAPRMIVDDGEGITRNQVIKVWQEDVEKGALENMFAFSKVFDNNHSLNNDVYFVSYRKSDGSVGRGKFIFVDGLAGKEFGRALDRFWFHPHPQP